MVDLQSLSKEELFQYMEEVMRWDNAHPPRQAEAQTKVQPAPQPAPIAESESTPNSRGGPRTAEGKAKSSLNNLQHGLTGSFRIVGNESQEEFGSVVAAFTDEHQPATATELVLVEKMAEHLWLSRRAQRLQDFALTEDNLQRLSLYMRYQTTNDRAFHKCLTELKRLQKERGKFVSQNDTELERDSVKSKVRLANARANHLEIDAQIRQKLDIPSENSFAVPFQEAKELFTRCLVEMAAKLSRERAA